MLVVALTLTVAGTAACAPAQPTHESGGAALSAVTRDGIVPSAATLGVRRAARPPLRGLVIALDPGHQLGNHNFPRQINALVPAGGFSKPCNSTGTATNRGVPEATVNIEIARAVRSRLRALGATVRMTRTSNRESRWGPCVDARGRFGKRVGAALMVSLHADGAASGARGFHVIRPTRRAPWTTDIARPSRRLARQLRNSLTAAGIPRSSYLGHGRALVARSDLATLNMSDVPAVMVEVGNMRNTTDARRMTSTSGQARYAEAIVRGIRTTLQR